MGQWTAAEAASDTVSKKMLLQHLQEKTSEAFLEERKLSGPPAAVLKRVTKEALVAAYIESMGKAGAAGSGASKPDFKFASTDSGVSAAAASPAPAFSFSPPAAVAAGSTGNFSFNFAAAPSPKGKTEKKEAASTADDEDEEKDSHQLMQKRMAQLNMSAAQRRDATLAELPAATRGKVEELEKLQEQSDEFQREFDEKLAALRQEYEKKKAPLYKERSDIVNGSPGVSGFWLTCLTNHMMLADEIQKVDEPVLSFLKDIKYSSSLGPGKPGFQLAFVFSENPYFENEVLTKTYLLDPTDEDECLQRTIGTDIKWKEGKDVTVRVVEKKQKKKGKLRTIKVEEPADSFFNFFDPAEVPDDDEDMDEEEADQLHEQLENDYEIGCIIKDRIVPRAVAWFTGAAVDPEEDYDEEDDYEEEEDDEDDEEDEEEFDDEEEDEEEDDDHVDTSKMRAKGGAGTAASAGAGGGAKSGPAGEECKQQ